jgi:hypothetical protein
MPGRESFAPAAWLYAILSGDSMLAGLLGVSLGAIASRVGRDTLPLGTPSPYVLINEQSEGRDVQGIGGIVIMTSPLWMVKAVVHSSDDSALIPIVDRLHALLHRKPSTPVTGIVALAGTRVGCMRESTHYLAAGDDTGQPRREAGHIWRLFVEDH